ncbi:unnamed protein product [Mytilus edulis]|uniref:Ig-like domain-containing protein n=1 Tax=Mytilus edulis TaxID=6550 RepID=A0A8S3TNS4_MYTED|nr:unnamed protein product [Mytilus edulis]
MFKFLILVHVCAGFPLKCPEPAQWSTRARGHCPDPSKYFCLKNDLINGYSENCTIFDFLQPGRKHVLRGGLDADICSSERYQPWPITFYTNVSTNCIFLKSACNEEGQVVYEYGNRSTDTTCRCDYTSGYDFIVKPRNQCFCVPSKEDCSCYLKMCPKATDKLSPDYKCLHAENNITVSECKPIIYERIITASNETEFISRREHISNNGLIIVFSMIVLTDELLDRYWREAYFLYKPFSHTTIIEGDDFELTYQLSTHRVPIRFLRNGHLITEGKNVTRRIAGRWKTLLITGVTMNDAGLYCLEVSNNKSEPVKLSVQRVFTSKIEPQECIEGNTIQLTCSVYADNIEVKWYKEEHEIQCQRCLITSSEHDRTLTIQNTTVGDSGMYHVKANNVQMKIPVTVKAIITRPLENVTIMEGLDTILECETEEENCPVQWLKNDEEISNQSDRIKMTGKIHRLTLLQTSLEDSGTYTVKTKGRTSHAVLTVKEGQVTPPCASGQNEEFADCGFWDFAGQKEFYATHQTFLSTNSVYLLVVDISRDFKTKTFNNMIEKEFNNVGEYIDFWLDNIHCYSTDDKNISSHYIEDGLINPPVIIVGTGIDKVKEAARKYFSEAKALGNWGDQLPTRWIVLEKEMYMRKEKHVLKYTDAKELATDCSFPDVAKTTSELESFLKYEHDIGNIIFFKDVNNFIVLDPEWLANVFRCFVSHQYKDDLIGMLEWAILTKTGMLKENLINTLLKKLPSLTSTEHKVFILKLMEKFDIIVRPKNDEYKQHIYMPCMIKPMPFKDIFGKNDIENCKKSSWFCLVFNFLPPSYFNHILVSFVKSKQLVCDAKDKKLGIYRNIGIFDLNETGSEILVICLSKNLIAMQVRQLKNEDVCYSYVKKQLITLVDSIKQRYRINVFYEIRFKCQDGSLLDNDGIGYDEAMEKIEYRCTDHNEMHSSKDIYRSWLKEEEVEEERKNKGHRKCNYCKHMSVYKCYDCNQVLCRDCSRKHGNAEKYSTHLMQLISDSFILNCKFYLDDDVYGRKFTNDIICLPDGEVVAAVYNYKGIPALLVFSISGKQRHVIQLDNIPRKMDVVDKNTVAVLLDKHIVAIIDIQQNHVQYIRNIRMPNGLGTSFIYIENELNIGYEYGIVVIDMSGSVKRRITLSFTPCDMCYDVDSKRIYCLNRKQSQLICINKMVPLYLHLLIQV